jgi:hypothetical protein
MIFALFFQHRHGLFVVIVIIIVVFVYGFPLASPELLQN